jgi:tetratricopeptide (TPR) repeat protein
VESSHDRDVGTRRFGTFLRGIREGRRLSLDSVEEMSTAFPEPITKSHLSRIENGQAIPSFPRLFALSRIYGVPIASLAERFEMDLVRKLAPVDVGTRSDAEALEEGRRLIFAGRHLDALALIGTVLERGGRAGEATEGADVLCDLKLCLIDCLLHLGHFETAKSDAEKILGEPGLTPPQRTRALQMLVLASFRMGRLQVAMMALEHARRSAEGIAAPRLWAHMEAVRGNILVAMDNPGDALEAYRDALQRYEQIPDPFEACKTRLNMASALLDAGGHDEARGLLERASTDAAAAGYDRLRAIALSHMAVVEFRSGDHAAAEKNALRSNAVARERDYTTLIFRNCYYLWQIARVRGDEAAVRANERTLRTYLGRLDEPLREAEAYRSHVSGGEA